MTQCPHHSLGCVTPLSHVIDVFLNTAELQKQVLSDPLMTPRGHLEQALFYNQCRCHPREADLSGHASAADWPPPPACPSSRVMAEGWRVAVGTHLPLSVAPTALTCRPPSAYQGEQGTRGGRQASTGLCGRGCSTSPSSAELRLPRAPRKQHTAKPSSRDPAGWWTSVQAGGGHRPQWRLVQGGAGRALVSARCPRTPRPRFLEAGASTRCRHSEQEQRNRQVFSWLCKLTHG